MNAPEGIEEIAFKDRSPKNDLSMKANKNELEAIAQRKRKKLGET